MSEPQPGDKPTTAPPRREPLLARVAGPLMLLGIVLALFGKVLIQPNGRVLGAEGLDTTAHILWWHAFLADELRRGNLPLWNPHVYGGGPFLGAFASGALYPPNWLELLVPVHVALNVYYASHVFLAGLFTYLCCRGRGLSKKAGVLAGAMFMLSGPYFLHVYAGHTPVIGGMTWLPLALLAADRLADTGKRRWLAVGAAAVALQVYGGSQHFYMTGLVGGAYAVLHALTASGWRGRVRPLLACAAIFAGGVLLAAPELFATLEAKPESWRSGGLPIEVAAMFSLPPENLATALVPHLFGPADRYFGRCYLWEVSMFVSVTGLLLAGCALAWPDPRRRRFGAILVIVTLVLALGYHTPLFKVLYQWLPGFNAFRAPAKYADYTALFLAMLAAVGLDQLADRARGTSRQLVLLLAMAAALLVVSLVIRADSAEGSGVWARTLERIRASGESEAVDVDHADPAFIRRTGQAAADGFLLAFAVAAAVAALAWLHGRTRHASYALVALAVLELFVFARTYVVTANAHPPLPKPWADKLRNNPGDYRVMLPDTRWANWGMGRRFDNSGKQHRFENLHGYHPNTVTRRYLDFLAATQGIDPAAASSYVPVTRFPDILTMFRCRYVLMPNVTRPVIELKEPLPRALLVPTYVVATTRDGVLGRVVDPSFNPRRLVVLETEPAIVPQPGGEQGTVRVIVIDSDELHIDADVPAPTILLVTDNYSRLWRAAPRVPGPQTSYDVLPANWTLRAIPLAAGNHRIRLRYESRGLLLGCVVTGLTLATLAGEAILSRVRRGFGSRLVESSSDNNA